MIMFRMDFLKLIKEESMRDFTEERDFVSGDSGLHLTREIYVDAINQEYALLCRFLEEAFDKECVGKISVLEENKLREKIEIFLGRRIRTYDEILRDRRTGADK